MFRGFDFDASEIDFSRFVEIGSSLHKRNKDLVSGKLKEYRNSSGEILSKKMTAAWFPNIDAQVFISHAHKDSEIALGLAGLLHDQFGISAFVDSTVWGYSDDLLKILDDKFCYNEKSETYNYRKRNRSTAHVHMMLSVALSQMINRCECVIFINTPHSISSGDYIEGYTTDSPWIYSEILMTSLIQKRSPEVHRRGQSVLGTESFVHDSALTIKYDVNLDHLSKLNSDNYMKWFNQATGKARGENALDMLYDLIR